MIKAILTGSALGMGIALCILGGIIGGPHGTWEGVAVVFAGVMLVLAAFAAAWYRNVEGGKG